MSPPERIALALHEPDIPQNAATLVRAGACLDVAVHIVEPAGFLLNDRGFRRAGLDYLDRARIIRHAGTDAFLAVMRARGARVVAVETSGALTHTAFAYRSGDVLLLGSEARGLPADVLSRADAVVRIAMVPGARSLNVALAGAMVLGEALRQTQG